uniref:Uncharacterized protein n=1 Tax=Oryza rufipogon TaxID=4529 RepID=A0A0E0NFF6_ORYRU
MASASNPPKDKEPIHGRGGLGFGDILRDILTQGGAVVSGPARPPRSPPRSPTERFTQGRAREQPGGGGRGIDGLSAAAALVDRKGKRKIGEGSFTVSDDREQARRKEERTSDSPKVKLLRSSIRAYHGDAEEKLSDRKGEPVNYPFHNCGASTSKLPAHVYHKKIPMGEAANHYFRNIDNSFQQPEVGLRLKYLSHHYSEFRPVHRDEECFYRSFIFSYLEQVVDSIGTREEDRLLAAVRALATKAENLQWASEFSQKHKAFERLIEKIKGWKRMQEHPISIIRLVAATWMCTCIWNYEWCATNCGENQNLEDWCSKHVIAPRVYATSAAVKACAEALRVTVQVENVHDGTCESTHYIVRGAPRVTLLRIESHYEIIYPLPPSSINNSNPHEEKLLPIPSSILAYDRRKIFDRKQKHLDRSNQNTRASTSKSPPHEDQKRSGRKRKRPGCSNQNPRASMSKSSLRKDHKSSALATLVDTRRRRTRLTDTIIPPGCGRTRKYEITRMSTRLVLRRSVRSLYKLHSQSNSLAGRFSLRNFLISDEMTIEMDEFQADDLDPYTKANAEVDFYQYVKTIEELFESLPVPEDIHRWLSMIMRDPTAYQYLICYHYCLMEEHQMMHVFTSLYNKLLVLPTTDPAGYNFVLERLKIFSGWSPMDLHNVYFIETFYWKDPITGVPIIYGDDVLSLLRLVRNTYQHFMSKVVEGRKLLFSEKDFGNMVNEQFSGLLDEFFEAMFIATYYADLQLEHTMV